MNDHFTNREYAEMHFIYGFCNGNSLAAQREYRQRFPNRRQPSARLFRKIHTRAMESGALRPRYREGGRPRRHRHNLDEVILRFFERNPTASIRRASARFNTNNSYVWLLLNENGLYPYHFQRVHGLLQEDHAARLRFCHTILGRQQNNYTFLSNILFTDEACFTRDGVINLHNLHTWSDENPHATVETHHQRQFSLNVWAGIVGNHLLGPFFLPNRLGGVEYLSFLENDFPDLLDDVPLELRANMVFLQDGAPPHYARQVRDFLNRSFPGKWIGRGNDAPIPWPPRSPDLNAIDFYLWGDVKRIVYATPVTTIEELRQRIGAAFDAIRIQPEIFQRVRFNFLRRLRACISVQGGQFESLLRTRN